MYKLLTYAYVSDERVIPLLVQQVLSFQGISFQPRSRNNNHFNIFLLIPYVKRSLCIKSKIFLKQKIETNKNILGVENQYALCK